MGELGKGFLPHLDPRIEECVLLYQSQDWATALIKVLWQYVIILLFKMPYSYAVNKCLFQLSVHRLMLR